MNNQVIQVNKDELHELLVEYTKSNGTMTSNLLGELKTNQEKTKETLNEQDKKVAVIQNQMDNIEKKMDDGFHEMKQVLNNHMNTVEAHMETMNKRHEDGVREISDKKANKWVEKTLIAIGSAMGLIILGAIMSLIVPAK